MHYVYIMTNQYLKNTYFMIDAFYRMINSISIYVTY